MNRLRIGFAISVLLGAMYAACGLFTSLTEFSLGVVVASLAMIGYGLCDFLDAHHDDAIARSREAVWARRDGGS